MWIIWWIEYYFVKPFGNNSLESQKVIFSTEKEGINIYDQRMKNIAIKNNIPISYMDKLYKWSISKR